MPKLASVAIADISLASAASSVTFSNISQAYKDLFIIVSGTTNTGDANFMIRFNGDSGANYPMTRMYAAGGNSVGGSYGTESYTYCGPLYSAVTSTIYVNVMDFSATDKQKTSLVRQSQPGDTVMMVASRWTNTAAITSITCGPANYTMATGTRISIYGIVS